MKIKKRNFDDICKAIALKNGVSVETVKQEMQSAINYAFQNPTQQQKQFQNSIAKKGEIPTPEELFHFAVENTKRH